MTTMRGLETATKRMMMTMERGGAYGGHNQSGKTLEEEMEENNETIVAASRLRKGCDIRCSFWMNGCCRPWSVSIVPSSCKGVSEQGEENEVDEYVWHSPASWAIRSRHNENHFYSILRALYLISPSRCQHITCCHSKGVSFGEIDPSGP
jgi:hypothetical protein